MGRIMTSGSLGCVMLSTLAWNAREVGSILTLGTFITPKTLVAMTRILYKLCTVLSLNLRCVHVCEVNACMYVIVSIKRLTINSRERSVVGCTDLSDKELHRQV